MKRAAIEGARGLLAVALEPRGKAHSGLDRLAHGEDTQAGKRCCGEAWAGRGRGGEGAARQQPGTGHGRRDQWQRVDDTSER